MESWSRYLYIWIVILACCIMFLVPIGTDVATSLKRLQEGEESPRGAVEEVSALY